MNQRPTGFAFNSPFKRFFLLKYNILADGLSIDNDRCTTPAVATNVLLTYVEE